MTEVLAALKGAKLIGRQRYPEGLVVLYLLPTGYVLEIIYR